jgi:hypothetical protein
MPYHQVWEMMMRKALLSVGFAALALAVAAPLALADLVTVRGGGVELDVPAGWARVPAAVDTTISDPRTLLVVGTKGVRAIDTECQVATYRVPDDGAAVVVIGWRDSVLDTAKLELSKLRRGTFSCFAGRGAVGQVTRKGRDFQVNVLVGDDASAKTIRDALAVARSFAPR